MMPRLTIVLILFVFGHVGCEGLKPEKVELTKYNEIGAILNSQYSKLGPNLEKKVALENKTETKTILMDSSSWKSELSFLEEINPNQPEYAGAFNETLRGPITQLYLKEGEKGSLKYLHYQKLEDQIIAVQATIHEDKDVFTHHREINLTFSEGLLDQYSINGYQKILLKDTIYFEIKGRVF